MKTQSLTLGWELTAALSAVAGMNVLVVCAGLGNSFSWALPLLSSAAAFGLVAAILTARSRPGAAAGGSLGESRHVAAASRDVAPASQFMAQGAFQQAATLPPISPALAEIAAILRKDAQKEIKGSSEETAKIASVVAEFAFHTNILALNAAVQAACAGEAGMAVAVVSDEVRNLQQRRAQTATDVALPIEESVAKSGADSVNLDVPAESLRKMSGRVTHEMPLVDDVAAAASTASAAYEELASHSRSLLALVDKLQTTSGTCADLESDLSQQTVKVRRAPVRVLSRRPNRAALPLDTDEAARSRRAAAVESKFAGRPSKNPGAPDRLRIRSPPDASIRGTRYFGSMAFLDDCIHDIRFSVRQHAKNPLFALVAVLSLGVAIGANTAIFSLLNAVTLRQLPVPQASRLAAITAQDRQGRGAALSYAQVSALQRSQSVFAGISGWLLPVLNMEAGGSTSRSAVLVVTANFYSTYAVKPILGRALQASDTGAAVISFQCWQERFGGNAAILGETIRIEGQPFTVVGVMPARFSSPQIDVSADAAIPVESSPLASLLGQSRFDPKSISLIAAARLRDGVSLEQAEAQMRVLWPSVLRETQPEGLAPAQAADYLSRRIQLEDGSRGQSFLRSRFTEPLRILLAAVATLLLLACVNVATLLLARAASRSAEIGIRMALGAKRGRLMRQLFTESLLLAVASAAAGVLLALWAGHLLLALMWSSPIKLILSLEPDWRILGFTVAVAFVATILFGLAPGWMTIQESLNASLRGNARSVASGGGWLRRSLVAAQVALAVVLLVSAGLLVRTAQTLSTAGLGFQPEHVAALFLSPQPGGYRGANLDAYERDLLAQVSSLPGVASAAISTGLPVNDTILREAVSTAGSSASGSAPLRAYVQVVSYDFFKTLGAAIASGREFSARDGVNSPRVVVISQPLARRLFPNGDALGRTISVGSSPGRQNLQIAGIAADARFGSFHRHDPFAVYLPLFQDPKLLGYGILEVRAVANPLAVIPSVDAKVRSLGREFAYFNETLPRAIEINLAEERMMASLSAFFGAAALFLAVIGLYGLLTCAVNRRIREFGVRIALGADRRAILRLVLGEALALLAAGIALGIPLALAAGKILSSRLPSLAANDALAFAVAAGVLAAAGLVAAYVPALRASRVDPVDALRAE